MKLYDYLCSDHGNGRRVAKAAGLTPAFLSQIAKGVRGVPAERAVSIERATGGIVRRWDMRPDDWHRIWPELIGAEGAPDVSQPDQQAA